MSALGFCKILVSWAGIRQEDVSNSNNYGILCLLCVHSSHTSDLAPSGICCYRVSTGTGQPGVNILSLGEVESFDLKLLSWCGNTYSCLSRSVPEIH